MGVKRKYKKFKESDLRETTCSLRKVVIDHWSRCFTQTMESANGKECSRLEPADNKKCICVTIQHMQSSFTSCGWTISLMNPLCPARWDCCAKYRSRNACLDNCYLVEALFFSLEQLSPSAREQVYQNWEDDEKSVNLMNIRYVFSTVTSYIESHLM